MTEEVAENVVDYVELLQLVRDELGGSLPRLTCLARRMCHEDEEPEQIVNQAMYLVANGEREMDRSVYADVPTFLIGVLGGALAQRRSIVDTAHKKEHEAEAQAELDAALADVAALSDEDIAKENEAAGYDAAEHLRQNLIVFDEAIAEYQVPDGMEAMEPPHEAPAAEAPRPRGPGTLIALGVGALVMLVIAWQVVKLAGTPDSPVGEAFCVEVRWNNGQSTAPASLEGVLRLENENGKDFYVLAMQDAVCRTSGPPASVLEARGAGVDLQPFVGQKVRVEADLLDHPQGAHRPITATIRSVSAAR